MLAPLDRVQINSLLNQLPKRAQFAQERYTSLDSLENVVNLLVRGESTNTETDTAVRTLVTAAQSAQHVAGFQRGGGTGTAR